MDNEPVFKTQDQKPPRPKTLREFFDFIVKTFPGINHNEDKFFNFVIESFKHPAIEFQYRDERLEIEEDKFKFEFHNGPLSQFWDATEEYLKSLGVPIEEINKFFMNRRFR